MYYISLIGCGGGKGNLFILWLFIYWYVLYYLFLVLAWFMVYYYVYYIVYIMVYVRGIDGVNIRFFNMMFFYFLEVKISHYQIIKI